jgi:hypothetical protein
MVRIILKNGVYHKEVNKEAHPRLEIRNFPTREMSSKLRKSKENFPGHE